MRMKSNSTFRRFLMNLAITAACVVMPVKAWGADYIDLVNNSLAGWTLYWGSANTQTGTWYWTSSSAASSYGSGWNSNFDQLYGSVSAYDIPLINTHGFTSQQYAPEVDYTWLGKDASQNSYRFYVNSKSGSSVPYDILFTNNSDNPCPNYKLQTIPDGFNSSIRLGSCQVPIVENISLDYSRNDGKGLSRSYSSAEFQDEQSNYHAPYYNACAEKISRTFVVDKEHTLLQVNYAVVMRDPTGHNSAAQKPGFNVLVENVNDDGSLISRLNCGEDTKTSKDLNTCTGFWYGDAYNNKSDAEKGGYTVVKNSQTGKYYRTNDVNYGNSGWLTSSYDLRNYIGKKIRISLMTHDCSYNGQNAGGHYAYAYFTARLKNVKIDLKYCSSDGDFTATAPTGFDSYTWYIVSSNGVETALNGVEGSSVNNNVYYNSFASRLASIGSTLRCVMHIDGNSCDIVADTTFSPSTINPAIKVLPSCQKYVSLSDASVLGIKGDKITTRSWYVFSSNCGLSNSDILNLSSSDLNTQITNGKCKLVSTDSTFSYQFDAKGQQVRLDLTNQSGCTASTVSFVTPNPVASWKTKDVTVCDGTPVDLYFDYDPANTAYGTQKLKFTATRSSGKDTTVGVQQALRVTDAVDWDGITTHNYNFTVSDYYGCSYSGIYAVTVNPNPTVRVTPETFTEDGIGYEQKADDDYTFYVCPGSSKKISFYSPSNVKFSVSGGTESAGTSEGGYYYYRPGSFKQGSYSVKAIGESCTSTLYFKVAYRSDTVKLDVPSSACPYDTVTATISNQGSKYSHTYWWNSADATQIDENGSSHNIVHPDASLTYYCKAWDNYGCEYQKKFAFSVNSISPATFNFATASHTFATSEVNNAVAGHSAHYYKVPTVCSSTPLIVKSSHLTYKCNYYYSTSDDANWVALTSGYANAAKIGQASYTVDPGNTLKVYWKTQPYDNKGNELCASFDTVEISTYPDVVLTQRVNADLGTSADVCEGTAVTLKVEPFLLAAGHDFTTDQAKFSVAWTDPNGGYTNTTGFEQKVTPLLKNTEDDANGHYYEYTFTATYNDTYAACPASGSFKIYVKPAPNFTLEARPPYACANGVDTLVATDNAAASDPAMPKADARVVNWTWPAIGSAVSYTSIASKNIYKFTNSSTTDQTYTVTATSKLGCTASKSVVVAAAAQPKPSVFLIPAEGGAAIAFSENVAGELVSKSAICANTQYYLYVSDAELNYSALCSDTVWAHLQKNNAPYENVNWRSVTGGTVKSVSNANLTTNYNLIYGSSSVNNVAKMGYYTARTNDGSSATPVYDGYSLTINTPCGCVVTKTVKVEVSASPSIVVDSHSNFVCDASATDNTSLKLNATGTSYAGGTITYKWFSGSHKAGDVDAQSLLSSTSSVEVKHQQEAVSTYTVEVLDGKSLCYATQAVQIANQEVPAYAITTDLSDFCKVSGTKVSLKASSSDPVTVGYYLRNLDGTYPNVSNPWDGSAKSIDPTKYLDASNKIYVKAREARRYGENITDPDIMQQYCYTVQSITLNASIPPVINYGLYDATATNVNKTGAVCAGSQYTIKLQNTAAVSGKDVFEVYNLDSDTPDKIIWSNTVNFKMVATSSVFTAATDKTQERLRIKSYVNGHEDCATETTVVVKVNALPIVHLGDAAGAQNMDTVFYCANLDGVTLKATVTNDNGGAYVYTWTKAGSVESGNTSSTMKAKIDVSGQNSNRNLTYTVKATDNAGCVGVIDQTIVTAVDTPTFYRDFWRACKGGSGTYRSYETIYNQAKLNIVFSPSYDYKAYYFTKNNGIGAEACTLNKWGVNATWNTRTTTYTKTDGTKYTVDTFGTVRMAADFYLPMSATADEDTFIIVQTSKSTGCVAHNIVYYHPFDAPDADKVFFGLNVTDGDNITTSHITLNLDKSKIVSLDGSPNMVSLTNVTSADTVASVCAGSKLTFELVDNSHYDDGLYGCHDKNGSSGSYARTAYAIRNVSNNWYTGFVDPNGSGATGRGASHYTLNPNWTQNATTHYQVLAAPLEGGDCYVVGDFWVSQAGAPSLTAFRDNACLLDRNGKADAMLKFSAVSSETVAKNTYKWLDYNDGVTRLKDLAFAGNAEDYGADSFRVIPQNATQDFFGKSTSKTYYYKLVDKADGHCSTAPIVISATVYSNPEFTMSVTPDRACLGDTAIINVKQDYNYCNNVWQGYYYGKGITATQRASLYNDNWSGRPHEFTDKYPLVKQKDSIFVTAVWTVGASMTYKNKNSANLVCYRTKALPLKAFETPKPVLRLIKNTAEGVYAKNDIVETVTTTNSDSTGSRKFCPGADYRRVLWNANPDTMVMGGTNYGTSKTIYSLKDLTTGVVVKLNGNSKGSTDENKVLTANNHDYMLSAVTSNGCKSDSVTFVLPLSAVPSVSINDGAGAVCQGDPATTTLPLVATASNGNSYTFQWYKGNVMDDASKVGTDSPNYEANPISAFSKNSKTTAIYSVKVWNENKCLAMDSDTINIWPLPQFTLSLAPATACANKTVTLTANKGAGETNYVNDIFKYSWNVGSGNSFGSGVGAVSAPPVNASSASRLYVKGEVTVADHITCSDTTSIPVPTYGVPVPSVKLFAAAPTGKYNTGDEIPVGALLCPGATWYPVFKNKNSDINCDLDTFFVKNQLSGKVDTFTSASGTLANQKGGSKVYTLTANTNFLYSVKTSCGCESATSNFTLGLADAPKITISGNTSFCEGTKEKLTLTASAGNTAMNYTWGDPVSANTATVTFLPTDTRTIRVTGTSNDYGCPAMQDVTITQLARPHLTLSAKNNPVCMGSNALITASTTISDGSSEFTYNWDPAASGSSISVPVNSNSVTYTAIVTAKDMCKDTQSITVTSVPLPDPMVAIYKEGNANAANMICPGSSYYPLFTNANSSNAAYTCALDTFHFIHTDANGKLIDEVVSEAAGTPANQAGATLKYDMNGTVKYTYYAVSSCGCKSGSKTVTVQEATNPTFTLSTSTGSTSFCEGASTPNNITAAVASIGLVASDPNKIIDTWIWDAPATAVLDANGKATNTATITPADITYTVHGVSKAEYGGCPASASIKLTEMPKPSLSLTCEQPDVCVGSNAEIVANASVSDGTEVKAYNWTPTDVITSVSAAVSPYVSKNYVSKKLTVTCQAVAANGCLSDLKSVNIQAIPIPVPTVAVIDEATGNDVTGKVLCPGTKYHLLYHNAASSVSGDYISFGRLGVSDGSADNFIQWQCGIRKSFLILM
jgi:hypothetical protein